MDERGKRTPQNMSPDDYMLLAIAMALSLPTGPEKNLILHMTYGVVAFSIIVQGLSIEKIFKADALKRLLPDHQGGVN